MRACLLWPHPGLRTPASPVTVITPEIHAIWADMVNVMEVMPGVGLAAVQIGVPLRLAVVDCSKVRGQAILMANPEILHVSDQMRAFEEASPNLPGVSAIITRPRAVTVRYMAADGAMVDRDFVHTWATSVQHQIDHLNGRMYFDHLSPLKRQMLIAKSDKFRRRT